MQIKLNALIVDDEKKARDLLHQLLSESRCFSDIRLADSVDNACLELKHFNPDMVFLDVQMPGKEGFCFFDEMPPGMHRPEIVFVTAYEKFAIKAIKNNVFDYLLKPVSRAELNQCIHKFVDKRKTTLDEYPSESKIAERKPEKIKLTTRNGILFINSEDILYCKAEGNYTSICTGDKEHLCSVNLGKVEEMLPGNGFIRIGRSLVINSKHIAAIDRKKCEVCLCRESETISLKVPRQHLNELDIQFH